jgi:hypothetical protein
MSLKSRNRFRNRFLYPLGAPFEALWMGLKAAFKTTLDRTTS